MIVDARLLGGDRLCCVAVVATVCGAVSLFGDSPPLLLLTRTAVTVVLFFALFAAVVDADVVEIVDDIRLILFVLFLLFGAGGYSCGAV